MRVSALLAAALLSSGCVVHHRYGALAPAQAAPGDPFAGQAEAEGVRVVARAGDWRGWPENLEERLTPVGVTVENRSGRTLRVGPEGFELVDPGGFRHRALAPQELQREFAYLGGWGWYGWYAPWPYSWGWGPYGPYPGYWGGWWYARPSPPPGRIEGTLPDGGRFVAWVFFPLPTPALPRFELVIEFVDDATGKPFGAVSIPFLREGERWPPPPGAAPPAAPLPDAPPPQQALPPAPGKPPP